MRIFSATLFIFMFSVIFYAQDTKTSETKETSIDFSTIAETNTKCRDSNNYGTREGIVNAITFSDIISVEVEVNDEFENETFYVTLAGINKFPLSDKLLSDEFMSILSLNLVNQKVKIIGNKTDDNDKIIIGIINTFAPNKLGEVNRYILQNGMAKYVEPRKNLVPQYITCKYPEIETKAKEAKLGIWAK